MNMNMNLEDKEYEDFEKTLTKICAIDFNNPK